MSKPLVSIIVPTFNRKKLLKECITSVFDQDYPNWELIIVDDNSTDGTQDLIKYKSNLDKRIKLIEKVGERGAPASRNIGFRSAIGDYVIFLDSDDLLAPFCLTQRVNYTSRRKNLDFAVFPQLIFRNVPGDRDLFVNIPTDEDDLARFLTIGQNVDVPWVGSAPLWHRLALQSSDINWNESVMGFQDIQFHADAIISGMKYKYAEGLLPDSYWRQHDGERIGDKLLKAETLKSNEDFLFTVWEKICDTELPKELYRTRVLKCIYYLCLDHCWLGRSYNERAKLITKMKVQGLLENKEFVHLYVRNMINGIFSFSDTVRYRLDLPFRKTASDLFFKEGKGGLMTHQVS